MDKSPDAFRTISEVAEDLDIPQHVLRFWETRFAQIKPLKRGGGRRFYRPDDIDLLKGIRYLLYGEGYTIRGVQRILKEQGLRYVQSVWREGIEATPVKPGTSARPRPDEIDHDPAAEAPIAGDAAAADELDHEEPAGSGEGLAACEEADLMPPVPVAPARPAAAAETWRETPAPRLATPTPATLTLVTPTPAALPPPAAVPAPPVAVPVVQRPAPAPARPPAVRADAAGSLQRLQPEPPRAVLTPRAETPRALPVPPADRSIGLTRDDIRRLQAALFELTECRRLLDRARDGL